MRVSRARGNGVFQVSSGHAARCGVVAIVAFLGCTSRTQLTARNGATAPDVPGPVGWTSNPALAVGTGGQVGPEGGQAGSRPASGGTTTLLSNPGSGGGGAGGTQASGGSGAGGAQASGGTGGVGNACVGDADCSTCGSCGPEALCAPYHCRSGTCQLLCDECTSDGDCAIAYDATRCCRICPEAFPSAFVAAEPCLVRSTEAIPLECRPRACPDACEFPSCVIDAQYARCVQGACVASHCPRGQIGVSCRPLQQVDLDECASPTDCMVVAYAHCCGATKRAINRLYLEEYNQHPEWQSFGDPGICATIGMCPDDSQVTSAICNTTYDGPARCELVFPSR